MNATPRRAMSRLLRAGAAAAFGPEAKRPPMNAGLLDRLKLAPAREGRISQ
jgi:hypothetical protein